MRKGLKKLRNQRLEFIGEFDKYGSKKGFQGRILKTILLRNVRQASGEVATDHLWFTCGKNFEKLGVIAEGDEIQFTGRVTMYQKGYFGWDEYKMMLHPASIDYRISYPTKIRLIKRSNLDTVTDTVTQVAMQPA